MITARGGDFELRLRAHVVGKRVAHWVKNSEFNVISLFSHNLEVTAGKEIGHHNVFTYKVYSFWMQFEQFEVNSKGNAVAIAAVYNRIHGIPGKSGDLYAAAIARHLLLAEEQETQHN